MVYDSGCWIEIVPTKDVNKVNYWLIIERGEWLEEDLDYLEKILYTKWYLHEYVELDVHVRQYIIDCIDGVEVDDRVVDFDVPPKTALECCKNIWENSETIESYLDSAEWHTISWGLSMVRDFCEEKLEENIEDEEDLLCQSCLKTKGKDCECDISDQMLDSFLGDATNKKARENLRHECHIDEKVRKDVITQWDNREDEPSMEEIRKSCGESMVGFNESGKITLGDVVRHLEVMDKEYDLDSYTEDVIGFAVKTLNKIRRVR